MEVAASGIAVASLAIQLLHSTNTTRAFIRNVKDTPHELLRIASLLDRLCALFQDVADLLEQQTSLQSQHLQIPSDAIFACLKSCEESLLPLQNIATKYQALQGRTGLRRLQANIRMALRADEFRGFEMCIHEEIASLGAALVVNSTRIQLCVVPTMGVQQDTSRKKPVPPDSFSFMNNQSSTKSLTSNQTISKVFSFASQTVNMYHMKTIRFFDERGDLDDSERSLFEENEYYLYSRFLKYGIHCSQRKPLGSILPALRVFPTVNSLHTPEYRKMMDNWSVQDFQVSIASGLLHPYIRDLGHTNLLHLAASNCRPDVYRLLLDYGLKPDNRLPAGFGSWYSVCIGSTQHLPKVNDPRVIDTYRLLLQDYIEDIYFLDLASRGVVNYCNNRRWSVEAEWLLYESQNHLFGPELTQFRYKILKGLLVNFIFNWNIRGLQWLKGIMSTHVGAELFKSLSDGSCGVLECILDYFPLYDLEYRTVLKPDDCGSRTLSALSLIGVDAQTCIANELLRLPESRVKTRYNIRPDRVITFASNGGNDHTLDWSWDLDPSDPGFLLLSELSSLTVDSDNSIYSKYGPFSKARYQTDAITCAIDSFAAHYQSGADSWSTDSFATSLWAARFERRRAKKASKARTQLGQKRSRMPGSWV